MANDFRLPSFHVYRVASVETPIENRPPAGARRCAGSRARCSGSATRMRCRSATGVLLPAASTRADLERVRARRQHLPVRRARPTRRCRVAGCAMRAEDPLRRRDRGARARACSARSGCGRSRPAGRRRARTRPVRRRVLHDAARSCRAGSGSAARSSGAGPRGGSRRCSVRPSRARCRSVRPSQRKTLQPARPRCTPRRACAPRPCCESSIADGDDIAVPELDADLRLSVGAAAGRREDRSERRRAGDRALVELQPLGDREGRRRRDEQARRESPS